MRIIKNWRQTFYAYSTWALTIAAGIPTVWLSVPEEVKAVLPPEAMAIVSAVVALGGLAGRFIDQSHAQSETIVGPDGVNASETSE